MSSLTSDQLKRYARHFTLAEIKQDGQQRLLASSVLVVGVGGLGSSAAFYLAAAGVGKIGLVDFDHIELSNLQRQILHNTSRIGQLKVDSARQALSDLNPDIEIAVYSSRLTFESALELFPQYGLILTCCDNFSTRYVINDVAVLTGKLNISAAVAGFEGQLAVFDPFRGPCYRCLYSEESLDSSNFPKIPLGVIGVLPGVLGVLQATEAIKLLLGLKTTLIGRLLLYNALELSFREVQIYKDPSCSVCKKDAYGKGGK